MSACIHRVTVTQFRSISMPACFRRHLVGKTLRNVSHSDVTKYALSAGYYPAKARDYGITGVGLSVRLSVCYHDN